MTDELSKFINQMKFCVARSKSLGNPFYLKQREADEINNRKYIVKKGVNKDDYGHINEQNI